MRLGQIYVGAVLLGAAAATPVIARDEPQVEAHKEAFKFKRGLPSTTESKHLRPNLETRQEQPINTEPETNAAGYSSGSFAQGQPVNDANGRGAPILGKYLDARGYFIADQCRWYEPWCRHPEPQ